MADSAFAPTAQARASRIARATGLPRRSASAIEVASRRASRSPKAAAVMNTSQSDGSPTHDGVTSRRSVFLARVIAKFAKSDRVVALSRLAQLYDVTAIKSSCYPGATRDHLFLVAYLYAYNRLSHDPPITVPIGGRLVTDTATRRHAIALDEEGLNPTIPERPRRALRTCRANVNRLRHGQDPPQPLPVHRRGSDPT